MYPHHIRLAAPWEPVTVDGTSRLRRRFGRPRHLDDWERIWLIPNVAPNERIGAWRLNGGDLEWTRRGDGPWRADVTKLLRERNEVIIEGPEFSENRPFGGATLEIGCRAFVQQLRVQPHRLGDGYGLTAAVDVTSESADDPLELYLLIDGENYGYRGPIAITGLMTCEFQLNERVLSPGTTVELRVDLVCRSTVWDSCEMNVTIPAA